MMSTSKPVLECQDCGRVLRRLSPGEAQQVATRPYDFVVLCDVCLRETGGKERCRVILSISDPDPGRCKNHRPQIDSYGYPTSVRCLDYDGHGLSLSIPIPPGSRRSRWSERYLCLPAGIAKTMGQPARRGGGER